MIKRFTQIFDKSHRFLKSTEKDLADIRALEKTVAKLTDEEMAKRVQEMKDELQKLVEKVPDDAKKSIRKVNRREKFPEFEKEIQNKLFEFLPEFFAFVNEQYKRVNGITYFDVQLKAGILLSKGQMLVEQYTGEGKTMTFQLPLALYSLVGRGAHLVTVNEYLTKVGAEYAGHVLGRLGITIGIIAPGGLSYKFITDDEIKTYKDEDAVKARKNQKMSIDAMTGVNLIECSKQIAYGCDITYSTNNELGFDYLRDNMAWDLSRKSQRELYFCVIDEADSILIDEARTPLIISSTPSDAETDKYERFAKAVKKLKENDDYTIDHKSRSVNLTETGIEHVEQILEIDNLWEDYSFAYHLENALKAKALFIKDDQYIIRNGQVLIVDEFTGRVLDGRRYSEGLHQAIEAKEGVQIQQESRTFATITFQNFFRLYKVLCGGSGTIITESEEFYKIYGLDSVAIPTNRPRIRVDHSDRIFKTQDAKFRAVVQEIKEMHELGRPVLIGTTSVEKSEVVSSLLDSMGIKHQVLNAKFHEQESRIVAEAGQKGAVTVATNMAGRGTDIVIGGGVRGDKHYQEIAELGGLHVIGTERHDSRRIDNQLRGRTGRQGEPGSTRFYASMDDQIMKVLGGDVIARLMNVIRVPDDMPIEVGIISRQIEMAQKRVESINFDMRKRIVEYDDVMNQHREIFYSRRFTILNTVENAIGRFMQSDGTIVDLNLPEHKDKLNKFENRLEEKRDDVRTIAENMVLNRVEDVLLEAPESNDKKDVQKFIKKLTNLVPQDMFNKHMEVDNLDKFVTENTKEPDKLNSTILEAAEKSVEEKIKQMKDDFFELFKAVSLENLDKKWIDHLDIMKDVKDSISLQGFAQKDPLVEYKNVAYRMFESFIANTENEIVATFFRVTKAQVRRIEQPKELETNQDEVEDVLTGSREMILGDQGVESGNLMADISKAVARRESGLQTNTGERGSRTKSNTLKKYGRNDKVSVRYTDGKELKDVKFKKVEDDVKAGRARIIK